jgi:hypothetical protein
MTASDIIQNTKLTPEESKAVKAAKAQLANLPALEAAFRDPEEAVVEGKPSGLYDHMCETAEAFTVDPTIENFKSHLAVLAEIDLVRRHRTKLLDLGYRAIATAHEPLRAVAAGVLDRAAAEIQKRAAAGAEHAKAAGLEKEHEVKIAQVQAQLEAERAEAFAEFPGVAAWLAGHGLA